MFAEERKEEIMRLLKENKRVSSAELSERFHVSGTTVRTYLMELEKAGRLIRTHGGALLNDDILNVEESIAARKQKCLREKQKAAAKARSMIKDGDTILLDSGTTMLELAKLLKDAKNLTVVTNDLPTAMELQKMEGVYLILIGGHVRTAFESTVGSMGMKFLENISVEKAFMSSDGVSLTKGATTPNMDQAEIKKEMMAAADQNYLVCDTSKIGKRTICSYAKIVDFDGFILDEPLSDEMKEAFESHGTVIY